MTRRLIPSGSPYEAKIGFSRAVAVLKVSAFGGAHDVTGFSAPTGGAIISRSRSGDAPCSGAPTTARGPHCAVRPSW